MLPEEGTIPQHGTRIHPHRPVQHHHPAGQSNQQMPPRHTADTAALSAVQAPGNSAIWHVPEKCPHCSDSGQAWAQLTNRVAIDISFPLSDSPDAQVSVSAQKLMSFLKNYDFSTENTIGNYRDALDTTPQPLANRSPLFASRYRQRISPLCHRYPTTEALKHFQ